jgi:uncharacterized low-complexity protein
MNYKQIVPAVALTLGVAASMNSAQAGSLFQMSEVASNGTLIAEAEHHCGADKATHDCAGKKDAEHKCAAKKDAEHKCAADKAHDEHESKDADHKCAAGACGADK